MPAVVNADYRDVFLSHSSADKDVVRNIAAMVEAETWNGRALLAWFDEAEIPVGGSIPGHVDRGLASSRFFAVCMSRRPPRF